MSEFLFIIPEGWTQLPEGTIGHLQAGVTGVQTWVSNGNMSELTYALREAGQIPADLDVVEARLFNGDMLVVRFAAA